MVDTSAVTGQESSQVLGCQYTKIPCHR